MVDDSTTPTGGEPVRPAPGTASVSANRVAAIIGAAEETAKRLREDAETRLRERIAEADRAAGFRVAAAEDEAGDIIAEARKIAERIVQEARGEAARIKTDAGAEAMTIRAAAEHDAREIRREAEEWAAERRADAERRARDLASEARAVAGDVRAEGVELTDNLRELGGSLRANAERLLRDVLKVHQQLAARIDEVDPTPVSDGRRGRSAGSSGREWDRELGSTGAGADVGSRVRRDGGGERNGSRRTDDDLDVPEFIPQR